MLCFFEYQAGVGKSTFLKTLTGQNNFLNKAPKGEILVNGQPAADVRAAFGSLTGLVPQKDILFAHCTVR